MDKLPPKSSLIATKKATAFWFLTWYCCFFSYALFPATKKNWTFLVYMAADNDLESFATKNLSQMQQVGSTDNVSIVVNLNSVQKGIKSSTVYYVQQGSLITLQEYNAPSITIDAGDPQTLTRFCTYAIEQYPADHYALIFWNHGTGILEPNTHYRTSYLHLFSLNNARHKQKATKSNTHALPLATVNVAQKAICFDDTSGNFLTESDLVEALSTIRNTVLKKPFDIIGFDACLMGMIEIATTLAPFATYLVASQEVELGWGWNYELVLRPFKKGTIRPKTLGIHLVNAYAKTYESLNDYALSLVDLQQVESLKSNISRVAELCATLLTSSNKKKFKDLIRLSRNKHFCTHFDEPSFIDLAHFYKNILDHSLNYAPEQEISQKIWGELLTTLTEGLTIITKTVLYNKTGIQAPKAHGVSIYFPEYTIHYSYFDSIFAQSTAWLSFLNLYLQGD